MFFLNLYYFLILVQLHALDHVRTIRGPPDCFVRLATQPKIKVMAICQKRLDTPTEDDFKSF